MPSPDATPHVSRTHTETRVKRPRDGEAVFTDEVSGVEEARRDLGSASSSPEEGPAERSSELLEALRRPYAALTPPPKPASPSTAPAAEAQPSTSPPRPRALDPEPRQRSDNSELRRRPGTCPKHGLARSPSGECLLCKKEASPSDGGSRLLRVGGVTLLVGAIALGIVWLLV